MVGRRWRNVVLLTFAGLTIIELVRRRLTPKDVTDRAETETERVRDVYERAASHYDQFIGLTERPLIGDGRAWVAAQTFGDVLEIAVGTGRNIPYYPRDVRLVGQDISPAMLEIAHQRASVVGRNIDLREGDAQALEFPDETFDVVVSTLSLCTIPDDARAVAEATRVLRTGGRFVLLEHVRSPNLAVRLVQRLLDPLLGWLAADHLLREPLDHIKRAGLVVNRLERGRWGVIERLTATKQARAPHVSASSSRTGGPV
jgi:ubiquinone/menaquinone biosynthesis C-methylase UbiE